MTGERVINAPQSRVFDALRDPVILRQAIPGCQALTRLSDERYEITAGLKIGSARSTFVGIIEVTKAEPPNSYALSGNADGGHLGTATGGAHIALAAIDADSTNLAYQMAVALSGDLASIPDTILQSTAKTLAAEFFSRLSLLLEDDAPPAALTEPASQRRPSPPHDRGAEALPEFPESREPDASAADEWASAEVSPKKPEVEREPELEREHEVEEASPATDATGAWIEERPARTPTDDIYYERATVIPAEDEGPAAEPPAEWRRPTSSTSFSARRPSRPRAEDQSEGGSKLWRWLFAIIGAVVIAMLLSNGF
nr:carbon monoxide dehydrogenase subunit G [Acuticoccus mangrovi]